MKVKQKFINRNSHWVLLSPYIILFCLFILIPVISAVVLSFTYFNAVQSPKFIGLKTTFHY